MTRKYFYFALFISLLICSSVIMYNVLSGINILYRGKKDVLIGEYASEDFISQRNKGRASYDHLMRHLLHPQHPCIVSLTLGGTVEKTQKVDGDKVVCLQPGRGIQKNCTVYSFGVGADTSFEEAVRKRFGCQMYLFDPSIGMSDVEDDNVWFYNLGLADFDGKVEVQSQIWEMKTFGSILNQLNHSNKVIDILKLDIEGSEIDALEDMLNKGLLDNVNHLCVELHLFENPFWERLYELLRRIEDNGFNHFSTRNNTLTALERIPGFFRRYEQTYFEMAWYRQ